MAEMERLRAAVIGVGYLGRYHAEKYAACEGVELVGVADTNEARAGEIAARHGCRAVTDFRELLPEADLVSVVVPTDAHYSVASACLAAGLHVLVEKPITRTVEEADALVALAAARGLRLAVGHLERFNPAFVELRAMLPQPLYIETERLSAFKERGTEVDVVADLMIHDLDLVLSMARAEISWVSACGYRALTDSVDIASVRIEFADGSVANLSASRVSQTPVRKLRAFGPDRYVSADLQHARVRVVRRADGGRIMQDERAFPGADALRDAVASFVAAARENRDPEVSGKDGRRALALAIEVRRLIDDRLERMSAGAKGKRA
jgi:predicted dehydrogenase